jgi:hypothetical protein
VVDLVQFTNFGDLVVRRLAAGEDVAAVTALDLDEWDDVAPADDRVREPANG